MCVQFRSPARFALRLALALLLISAPLFIIAIPTGAQDTEEPAATADEAATETDPGTETGPDADTPPESEVDPVDEPSEPVDETGSEPEPGAIVDEATPEPDAEVPPPSPALAFESAAPNCLPLSGDPNEPIGAGGDLEYSCTLSVALDGANLDPASIVLDWTVSASADADGSVQLLDPTGDPSAWTETGLSSASLGFQTVYSADTSIGTIESLQDVATIQIGLRVHRSVCSIEPISIALDGTGYASIPGNDQAIVTTSANQPPTLWLQPALAPLDTALPSVSIVDVAIDPVAFSLSDSQTHGTLTIQVDNPTLQCRQSNVLVAIQSSAGSEIAGVAYLSAVGLVDASSVAGAVPDSSGEGSSLDTYVIVSSVQDRAGAGSYQQTIGFDLAVPGGIAVGSYQLSASAVVESAE